MVAKTPVGDMVRHHTANRAPVLKKAIPNQVGDCKITCFKKSEKQSEFKSELDD